MKPCLTMLGIFCLLVCTACTEQPKQASFNTAADQPRQYSTIEWDQVTAAHEAAKVNNNGLIMAR